MSLQSFLANLQSYMAERNEVMTIKQWREENHIVVDERYLAKANKRERILITEWKYIACFAFIAGMLLGMYI